MTNKKIDKWIVIFIGIVFVSAALYRIFNYQAGIQEFTELGISTLLIPFVILLELVVGTLFILNKKVIYASLISIIFLAFAIVIAMISNFKMIINNLSELFIFNANPTDILLHISYVILLLLIYFKYKDTK
jgi:uncharacterized membrane protein YphA (DoxX/SURF4 family)